MKTRILLLPILLFLVLSGFPAVVISIFIGSAVAVEGVCSESGTRQAYGYGCSDNSRNTGGGTSGEFDPEGWRKGGPLCILLAPLFYARAGCASAGVSSYGQDRAVNIANYNVGDYHPNWPHVVKGSDGRWTTENGYVWVDADAPYDMRVKADPRVAALRQQEDLSRVNTKIIGSRRKLLEFQSRRFYYQEQTRRTLDSTYVPQPPAVLENWQASFWQKYGISDAFDTAKRNLETFRKYVMNEGIREALWYTLSGALKEAGYEHVDTFVSIERNLVAREVPLGEYWKQVAEANAYLPPSAYGRIEGRSRENLCGYARDVYVELYPLPDGLDSARRFVPSPSSCR